MSNRFCKDVLDLIQKLNMVAKSIDHTSHNF